MAGRALLLRLRPPCASLALLPAPAHPLRAFRCSRSLRPSLPHSVSLCRRPRSEHPEVQSTIKPPPGKSWREEMTAIYGGAYAKGFMDMSAAAASS